MRYVVLLVLLVSLSLRAQDPLRAIQLQEDLVVATNDTLRARILTDLCFHLRIASPEQARKFGAKALTLGKKIRDHEVLTKVNNELGLLDQQAGRHKEAIAHFRKALELRDTLQEASERMRMLEQLVHSYRATRKYDDAARCIVELRVMAQNSKQIEAVLGYELELAELEAAQGKSASALLYFNRYMALKDSLHQASQGAIVDSLRTFHALQHDQHASEIAQSADELERTRVEHKQFRTITIMALSLLLIAIAVVAIWGVRKRQIPPAVPDPAPIQVAQPTTAPPIPINVDPLGSGSPQLAPAFILDLQTGTIDLLKEGRTIEALSYLQGLTKLMIMVRDRAEDGLITVSEELAFLRLFIKLASVSSGRINFSADADRELLDGGVRIPLLVIQPALNAVLAHGSIHGEGLRQLNVRFTRSGNGALCTISDNATVWSDRFEEALHASLQGTAREKLQVSCAHSTNEDQATGMTLTIGIIELHAEERSSWSDTL